MDPWEALATEAQTWQAAADALLSVAPLVKGEQRAVAGLLIATARMARSATRLAKAEAARQYAAQNAKGDVSTDGSAPAAGIERELALPEKRRHGEVCRRRRPAPEKLGPAVPAAVPSSQPTRPAPDAPAR